MRSQYASEPRHSVNGNIQCEQSQNKCGAPLDSPASCEEDSHAYSPCNPADTGKKCCGDTIQDISGKPGTDELVKHPVPGGTIQVQIESVERILSPAKLLCLLNAQPWRSARDYLYRMLIGSEIEEILVVSAPASHVLKIGAIIRKWRRPVRVLPERFSPLQETRDNELGMLSPTLLKIILFCRTLSSRTG